MISYEVAMGLSIVAVFMTSGSMSTSDIVHAQAGGSATGWAIFGWHPTVPSWYAVLLLPSFIIYGISAVGETNRAPFDLAEAESELVGGFHTEYSSFKFAMFYLAEYINMITVSAVCATLFLGGWRVPWPLSSIDNGVLNTGWIPMLWWFIKVLILLFVFIWLRATLPRMRYDQFMHLGWKVLLPVNLVWILALAGVKTLQNSDISNDRRWLFIAGVAVVVLLIMFVLPSREKPAPPTLEEEVAARPAGSFPLPPLDLQVPPSPRLKRLEAKRLDAQREPATVAAGDGPEKEEI